jgi:glutamine amidotransferase
MKRITVIDYGIGNVHSVVKALTFVGADVTLTADPGAIAVASQLVLPGVGAFGDGMRELTQRGLIAPIVEAVAKGTPLLGICLGMQLLLDESDEFGTHRGLGLIPGSVRRIEPTDGAKVPHVGWNRLEPAAGRSWAGTILANVTPGTPVYFVHSYAAHPASEGHRLADTTYGGHTVSAAICRGNVTGCQFHPEKSGPVGLSMLEQFVGAGPS